MAYPGRCSRQSLPAPLRAICFIKEAPKRRIGRAEEVAARLVDEAKNRAELLSKERINEAKEEVHRLRNECDRECKERRAEIQKSEKRFNQREEQLEKKFFALDTREDACVQREKELQKQLAAAEELQKRRLDELERVAGLTANEAKEELVSAIENEARRERGRACSGYGSQSQAGGRS